MRKGLAPWHAVPANSKEVACSYHTLLSRGIGYLTETRVFALPDGNRVTIRQTGVAIVNTHHDGSYDGELVNGWHTVTPQIDNRETRDFVFHDCVSHGDTEKQQASDWAQGVMMHPILVGQHALYLARVPNHTSLTLGMSLNGVWLSIHVKAWIWEKGKDNDRCHAFLRDERDDLPRGVVADVRHRQEAVARRCGGWDSDLLGHSCLVINPGDNGLVAM